MIRPRRPRQTDRTNTSPDHTEEPEMSEPEIIELKLTRQEAHIILRALASHNAGDANAGDRQPCTWIAERLLRILSPELGPQPLAAILRSAGDEHRVKPG